MSSLHFNPLTTNAVDLRYLLQTGQITSVQIVERYLEHIELHEPTLNALASIAPCETLRRCAALLDDERSQGNIRGPFHGIPIILKVCVFTTPLTCGDRELIFRLGLLHHCIRARHDHMRWSCCICRGEG